MSSKDSIESTTTGRHDSMLKKDADIVCPSPLCLYAHKLLLRVSVDCHHHTDDGFVLPRLAAVTQHGVLNITQLTCDRLARLLPQLLPAAWLGTSTAVTWAAADGTRQPSEEWLRLFWDKAKVLPLTLFSGTAAVDSKSHSWAQEHELQHADACIDNIVCAAISYRANAPSQHFADDVAGGTGPRGLRRLAPAACGRWPAAPAAPAAAVASHLRWRRLAETAGIHPAKAGLSVRLSP